MAFRKYEEVWDVQVPVQDSGFYDSPVMLGEQGMKDRQNKMEMAKARLEQQNKDRDFQMKVDDAEQKKIEKEIIMRAVYGNVGDNGQGEYEKKLNEELINPAQPMTEAEFKFRKNPMNLEMIKTRAANDQRAEMADDRREAAQSRQVEAALAYIGGFTPDMTVKDEITGQPRKITRQDIMRLAAQKYKTVPFQSDERFEMALNGFSEREPEPEKKSFDWSGTARRAIGTVSKMNPFREKSESEKAVEKRDSVLKSVGEPGTKETPPPEPKSESNSDLANRILAKWPDAKLGKDGNYYVQRGNQLNRVRLKSAVAKNPSY